MRGPYSDYAAPPIYISPESSGPRPGVRFSPQELFQLGVAILALSAALTLANFSALRAFYLSSQLPLLIGLWFSGALVAVGSGVGLHEISHKIVAQRYGHWAEFRYNLRGLGLSFVFALFGFLIPIPLLGGIGARTAIVALVVYSLLPILQNTYAGIRSVDPAVSEAATALGMTDRQKLASVELPLALPVVLAGVRIAVVVGIGLATIAAAIGAGGLGVLIYRGVATVDHRLILAGAVPAAILALASDFVLGRIERRWGPKA